MSTYFQSAEDAERSAKWVVVDATDVPLGRLASKVAHMIRGKHRVTFTPHVNGGDFVVVLNAEKVKLTGKKATDKFLHTVSGYPGGVSSVSAGDLRKKNPARLIRTAVEGMLPSGVLGHRMGKKLKVYSGSTNPHTAQGAEPVKVL